MSVFQTSPQPSRLVIASHRNRFVILRTNNSLSITPHPASRQRSYFQLQGLWFTLVRTCTLLVECLRGRTRFGNTEHLNIKKKISSLSSYVCSVLPNIHIFNVDIQHLTPRLDMTPSFYSHQNDGNKKVEV